MFDDELLLAAEICYPGSARSLLERIEFGDPYLEDLREAVLDLGDRSPFEPHEWVLMVVDHLGDDWSGRHNERLADLVASTCGWPMSVYRQVKERSDVT